MQESVYRVVWQGSTGWKQLQLSKYDPNTWHSRSVAELYAALMLGSGQAPKGFETFVITPERNSAQP